jgi:hypothetical protein
MPTETENSVFDDCNRKFLVTHGWLLAVKYRKRNAWARCSIGVRSASGRLYVFSKNDEVHIPKRKRV